MEIGIALQSLYNVLGDDPDFMDAVSRGRRAFDERVISSLAQRALGYDHQVEKVFSNGRREIITEHVPADVAAISLWLVNRKGWRRSENAAQDAVDAVRSIPEDTPSPRKLAMAAIALLSSASVAADNDADADTIDVTPNPARDTYEEPDEAEERAEYDDPNFDLD